MMQGDHSVYPLFFSMSSICPQKAVLHSLVDEGQYQLTSVLNFCLFNRPKKNSNSTQIILVFQSRISR